MAQQRAPEMRDKPTAQRQRGHLRFSPDADVGGVIRRARAA
jgi:hypothetical protein